MERSATVCEQKLTVVFIVFFRFTIFRVEPSILYFVLSACLVLFSSLPTVSEAAPSCARVACSGDIWDWEYVFGKPGAVCFANLDTGLLEYTVAVYRPILNVAGVSSTSLLVKPVILHDPTTRMD